MSNFFLLLGSIKPNVIKAIHDNTFRFQLAQILYICSISFGWYIEDGYRRALFLLALLLTSKSLRKTKVLSNSKGLTKLAVYLLVGFAVWITTIPLLFGISSVTSRLQSLARPLEVCLYVYGIFIFARDKNFIKYFSAISLVSAAIFILLVFIQRSLVSFVPMYDGWALRTHAAIGGLTVCMIVPWFLYNICASNVSNCKRCINVVLLAIASLTIVSTYYLTVWLAFCTQIISAIILCVVFFKNKHLLLILSILVIGGGAGFGYLYTRIPEVKTNVQQLLMIDKNLNDFTNNRVEIWKEAANLIKVRKTFGYGWVSYNDFASIKKNHPHSSYLEAAFITGIPGLMLYLLTLGTIFVLSLKNLFTKRGPTVFSYVIILMLVAYGVGSFGEAYFFIRREFLIPFWTTICMVIAPIFNDTQYKA